MVEHDSIDSAIHPDQEYMYILCGAYHVSYYQVSTPLFNHFQWLKGIKKANK